MLQPKLGQPILRFLGRSVVIFILLAAPWPGLRPVYCRYLLSFAQQIFPARTDLRELSFETRPGETSGETQARIVIVNRALMARDGSGPVRNLDIDLGCLGANSFGLLFALILATPASWKRRGRIALAGAILLHLCIAAFLGFGIWAESSEVGLTGLAAGARDMMHSLETTLLGQFSVAVPVLIWLATMFRGKEGAALFESFSAPRSGKRQTPRDSRSISPATSNG